MQVLRNQLLQTIEKFQSLNVIDAALDDSDS